MAHTNAWNNSTPLGSEFASSIDNHMRTMKLDVDERMSVCFKWNDDQTYDGYPMTLPFRAADNTSLISISAANSLTGSNASNMFDLAQTWNTTGAPTAIKVNITDTASDATSKLFDFQVGASSKGSLTKAGLLTAVTGAFGATTFAGNVVPTTDNARNFGSGAARWATGYFVDLQIATMTTTGNVAVGGTFTVTGASTFNGAVTFNASVSGGITTTDMTLSGNLTVAGTSALNGAVDIAGGLTIGSGNVSLVDSTGKITAISSTYFANLSGVSLTGVGLLGSANAWTSTQSFVGYDEEDTAISISGATLTVNMALGSSFTFTLDNTITTMTISNIPASGKFASFVLRVLANGSAQTWDWFANTVKWAGGTAPTRTTTSGRLDVFYFHTVNGGTTWFGSTVGQNWTP